ncbi:hypothetical protein C6P40_000798 [Pichia californica]|uniref:Patatin-like phospholipase domain-containing protein n=1 Tax=Pichia californica TaxID=460514 RepID=A0A9P7BH63_9ASCO|nr:hypothetical protein C6P42_000469 [[Candida] californica]KAG0690901.1 hypothetical protein C6P40_000798 [[Candida] californica]
MPEKVTAYDLSYLHNNPFENITSQILLNNIDKVDSTNHSSGNLTTKIQSFIGSFLSFRIKNYFNPIDKTIEDLYEKQKSALTYDDWLDASLKLDILEDNDSWKQIEESKLYDFESVREQLENLRSYRETHQYDKILYTIRTCWKRNFAGLNNEMLYQKSHVGTKKLITDYIEECVNCLASLVSNDCELNDEYILEVLLESKRNYGRGAITMSGGGTFGLIGIGVFSTLLEKDLFPKIISGSSCGSIVSSIMCSKTSKEIKLILSGLFDKTFEVFNVETDHDTFYTHLSRLLKYGVWFDSKYLQSTMKEFLGNITFKEAFNKTGRILNITVSSATIHDQPTLLNYLTAPNVLIWSAVCASCSLPVIFASSTIYEKNIETGDVHEWSNPLLKFVDGSLNSDLPISRLSEMFNVNHTIACQVNPHIAPLVKFASTITNNDEDHNIWNLKSFIFKLSNILSMELSHYCDVFNELGIMSNLATKLRQLMSQSYSGDITILPELKLGEESKTLVNPTPTFIWDCILQGARATWPKLSIIKDQYTVEFAMDKYISVLRSRVVFESKNSATSLSCKSSPRKNEVENNLPDLRKRGETITLSEKMGNSNNKNSYNNGISLSPFSSKVNLYKQQQRSPKSRSNKGYKVELSILKSDRTPPLLKPEHSFESLRYMQKTNNIINKKHTRSLSYTFIPEPYTVVDESTDEEIILPLVNNENGNNRRSSASSGIMMDIKEPIYPTELVRVKNKKE